MAHESAGGGGVAKHRLTVMFWGAYHTGRYTSDLRPAGRRDLEELREGARLAGDSIAVWAEFDDGEWAHTVNLSSARNDWGALSSHTGEMANPRALMSFCDWAMEKSPASQYALIIGSHGSGPKSGAEAYRGSIQAATTAIAFDDGSRQAMEISDLGRVCRHIASKGKLALVLLDACYMGCVEVAEALAGSAEVLVASPEAVPAEGMRYDMLLDDWANTFNSAVECKDTRSIAVQLAERAVNAFSSAYGSPAPEAQVASIVAVDLGAVPELLDGLDVFAGIERDSIPSPEWLPLTFVRTSDPDFAYVGPLTKYTCDQPIIDSWASRNTPEAGLTCYLPERGPLPRWWSDLPIAQRPFGRMVKRIVEGA